MTTRTTVTVSCDGRECRQHVDRLHAPGWTWNGDLDLCPRCSAGKCAGTLGQRRSWMSPDQYDPCPCLLPFGHGGPHVCEHENIEILRASRALSGDTEPSNDDEVTG